MDIIRVLKAEHARLTKRINGLDAAIEAFKPNTTPRAVTKPGRKPGRKSQPATRVVSAETRLKIARAQKKRWREANGKS